MFANCTSLTATPMFADPSGTGDWSHEGMFSGCTSLTTITSNSFGRTVSSTECYKDMFKNCTSLTESPVLTVTTMQNN
jgi:hypothetical protein